MAGLLRIEEALARVLERAQPLEAERVPVERSAGRFLAAAAVAAVDLPPFASSAMDGFALRAADTPGQLPVRIRIAAGLPAARSLEPGEAMGISTGGAVPEGADSVIQLELVEDSGDSVEVPVVAKGDNVRPRGGDIASGSLVLEAGELIGPVQVGALAAAGIASVPVGRRPRVAVVSTGTELRRPGEELGPGQIYESNSLMLAAAFEAAGAEVERLDAVGDDEAAHRAALERGLEADVLVSSGGVSVGPHDLVRRVGAELGVEEVFWGVSVKPGKPLAFGVRGRTLIFGLPGNPVSALVAVELFVRPALRALQGAGRPGPDYDLGRLAAPLRRSEQRDQLVRARVHLSETGLELEPLSGQESHMIARAAAADALVLVPQGPGELAAGSAARFLRL